MKPIEVLRYDAFSKTAGQGNPAGIVLEADGLTDWEMQKIAEQAGYNETAFLLPSESADIRIRYFTPGHEMNLCGHATVASLYALLEKGAIEAGAELKVETKAGVLSVYTASDGNRRFLVTLEQAPRVFSLSQEAEANWRKRWGSAKRTFMKHCPLFMEAQVYGHCLCR